MQEPIRVLHVLAGLYAGGGESLIMSLYRNVDRNKIQFDFLIRSEVVLYKDEITKLGGVIYKTAAFPMYAVKNWLDVKEFLVTHRYDIIHIHANSLIYITPIILSDKLNVKCIILHSHNAGTKYGFLKPIHVLNKCLTHNKITDRFACSVIAGKWMFGDDPFTTVKNGIEIEKYAFNFVQRDKIRKKLGFDTDTLVVGVTARLCEQKNLFFAMRVFYEINKKNTNSKFLIVGDGPLRNDLVRLSRKLNIENNVIFLGMRKDVDLLLNAIDIFLMPSLFEGLGISLIEAQANGLCCFCSDVIPQEARITPCVHAVSLSRTADEWAEDMIAADKTRIDTCEMIRQAGFDIKYEAKRIEEFYISKAFET